MNGAANGERNESLFQAACQMRDAGKDQHEIQTALMCRALADGLGIEEVNKTIVSVFKRPPREAATKQIKDLDGFIARITEPMAKCEIYRIGEANGHGSEYLLRKNWSQIEARLVKTKNKYQQKPTK